MVQSVREIRRRTCHARRGPENERSIRSMIKILFVSHCLLNTASKVKRFNREEIESEEALRRQVVRAAVDRGIQLVQLPCPEFLQYGSLRWGHCADQFDNPFFRSRCREMLEPILLQLEEYLSNEKDFEVLGVLGIDGSPSCGVRYTCRAQWLDEPDGSDRSKVFRGSRLDESSGVLMSVLGQMLRERGILVRMDGLYAAQPERAMAMLESAAESTEK